MIYVDSNYLDFDNLVEFGDNYVVLAKTSSVSASFENPVSVPVVIQYFTPSTACLESRRTYRSYTEFSPIEITDNFYNRGDCPQIMSTIFSWTLGVVFVINGLTRLIKRGGIFFGR